LTKTGPFGRGGFLFRCRCRCFFKGVSPFLWVTQKAVYVFRLMLRYQPSGSFTLNAPGEVYLSLSGSSMPGGMRSNKVFEDLSLFARHFLKRHSR